MHRGALIRTRWNRNAGSRLTDRSGLPRLRGGANGLGTALLTTSAGGCQVRHGRWAGRLMQKPLNVVVDQVFEQRVRLLLTRLVEQHHQHNPLQLLQPDFI